MEVKMIDVSVHNGVIDWDKVKASGIGGVLMRCGYGSDIESQDDKMFKRNADECSRLGIPFGVYLYSYAKIQIWQIRSRSRASSGERLQA